VSLTPAFALGLWNAWILKALALVNIVPSYLTNREATAKFLTVPPYSKTEKILYLIAKWGVGTATLVYSIFLPLKLGTVWFYVGLPIWFLGLAMNLIAGVDFATTLLDDPVTKRAYRISRNPAYFSVFLMDIGIGVACVSWIFLLLAMVYIILANILAISEERFCLEKYGNAYREYMNKTPKWIGVPKSGKK
jgi:hypothetical protein